MRYLSAYGRDVEMQPEALLFDRETKALSLTGKGKAEAKADAKAQDIIDAFKGMPASKNQLKNRVTGASQTIGLRVEEMISDGLIVECGMDSKRVRLLMPAELMESS